MAKFITLHRQNDTNDPITLNMERIIKIEPIPEDGKCWISLTSGLELGVKETYDEVVKMLIPWVSFAEMVEEKESKWLKDYLASKGD